MAIIALAAPALATGCGEGDGGDSKKSTSKKNGELTIYSGREAEYAAPLYRRYERETGTKVKVKYGNSGELAQTIIEEAGNSPADAFFSQDAGALGALQKEGLLEKLPQPLLDKVPARFRSAESEWVGTSGRARIVGFNRDEVRRSELPNSILGFTDARWKGRIGWAPTNSSFQAFVTAMRKTRGETATRRWLEGIVANDPQVYENNEAIRDAIASGEVKVGFLNHYYVIEAYEEDGPDYPVGIHYLTGGDPGSLVNAAGIGILKGAANSQEASRFIRFLLRKSTQRYFAEKVKEYPLASGVKQDLRLKPLDEIEQPKIDLSDLDDVKGTARLLRESGAL